MLNVATHAQSFITIWLSSEMNMDIYLSMLHHDKEAVFKDLGYQLKFVPLIVYNLNQAVFLFVCLLASAQ